MQQTGSSQRSVTAGKELLPNEYELFDKREQAERRVRFTAFFAAVVLHGLAFLIVLPETVVNAEPPPKKKVFVLETVRFEPPRPDPVDEQPVRRERLVPVPDPTPDEPEPIRPPEFVETAHTVDARDLVFTVPAAPPPLVDDGPLRVGGEVSRPVKLSGAPPLYTEAARKARIQGLVILGATIDRDGFVTNVKLVKGLPLGLSEVAMDAVRDWRFDPGLLSGQPVAVYYNLTVNFRLQ